MGLLTPDINEILLHRSMFEEKLFLVGVPGKFFQVDDLNLGFNNEMSKAVFKDPIAVNFIFEDFPSIQTLKRYNWWNDEEGMTAPIAFIPWCVNNIPLDPQIGALLSLIDPLGEQDRLFQITQVNANNYYMIHYAVKLAPYRERIVEEVPFDKIKEGSDGNFEYLNR